MTEKVQPYEIRPGVFKLEPRETLMLDGEPEVHYQARTHTSKCMAPIPFRRPKPKTQRGGPESE